MNSALWARATSLIFIFIVAVSTAPAILALPDTQLPNGPTTFLANIEARDLYIDKQRLTVVVQSGVSRVERVFVYTSRYPAYAIGESVLITCRLKKPEAFSTFAFDRYAQRYGVSAQCFYPRIVLASNSKASIRGSILANVSGTLRRLYKEPASALLRAIMLRETHEVPDDLRMVFSASGVAHVLAISGLHIGLLILLLDELLIIFRVYPIYRLAIIVIIIVLYLAIISFPASAIRASIMASALLLSRIVGRVYRGMHILIISAAVMLMWNPLLLWYDIGFQLSFLSIAGIITTIGLWQGLVSRFIPYRSISSLVSLTMSAQTFTWPLVTYYFGITSIISPITNLLIVPIASAVLFGGILSVVLAKIPLVVDIIRIPVSLLIECIIIISSVATRIPGSFVTRAITPVALAVYLTVSGVVVLLLRKKYAV